MNFTYPNIVISILLTAAVFNYAKAFLWTNTGLFLVKPPQSKKVKPTVNVKKTVAPQVVFNAPLQTQSEIKAKKDFDLIMSIPAYARKEMNVNYPASL